jgi:hypothetical protein
MFPKYEVFFNVLVVVGVIYLIVQAVRSLLFFWGV